MEGTSAGSLERETGIRAGLGKRFGNADEYIDHLEKLWISMRTPREPSVKNPQLRICFVIG